MNKFQVIELLEAFKYLGSLVTTVVGVEIDVQQRVLEGSKVLGAVRSVLKSRTLNKGVNKTLYQHAINTKVTNGVAT